MDYFQYRAGLLCAESVELTRLAEQFGTPTFVYSQHTLTDHYDRVKAAFTELDATICFSVKSCSNLAILRLLRERGAAFDVVSGGELARALEAGADPTAIVFAGVGKRDEEITAALEAGIGWFNVESEEELENLARLAERRARRARVALRINPDVDPKTHAYTTTGKRATKFGVDIDRAVAAIARFRSRPGLDVAGLHLHLGSPVNTIAPYVQAVTRTLNLVEALRRDGLGIHTLNLGGGFGAHYAGEEALPAAEYAQAISPMLAESNLRVLLEPGRSIAANAGILLTRVLYTKTAGDKRFVIVDAAMTELIRPALYGAFHFVWPVVCTPEWVPARRSSDLVMEGTSTVDIVGPVCESGDFLAKDRRLPPLQRGDLLSVFTTGAYGFSMSSQYNSRPRAAEVLVAGDSARLIRRRECYDDLVALERL